MIDIKISSKDPLQYRGLTQIQAEEALKKYGPNSLKPAKKKNIIKMLLSIFFEPMMFLLLTTSVVYYLIGDKIETIILLFSIIPIAMIEFFQEKKTDQAIRALDKMLTLYARVMRNGELVKIEVKEIVPGDLVYLTAGDRIPADGYLLKSPGLMIDEAVLTGESVPVVKIQSDNSTDNKESRLYQGTLAVQGEGFLLVEKTGELSEYGKLGSLLNKIVQDKTPLQQKIYKLVRYVAFVAIFFAIVVAVLVGLKQGIAGGVLAGLTMAISLIPEEFPIVFSVFVIMGVWRMAKKKILIREMVMVEILGSATVICTDKTGTLTEGKMSLEYLYYNNELLKMSEIENKKQDFSSLIKPALLALEKVAIDPIEIEIQSFAGKNGIDVAGFFEKYQLIQDSSFDAKTKLVSHLWKEKLTDDYYQFTAGAPESVIKYCNISGQEKDNVEKALVKLADQGYRVIGVARKKVEKNTKLSLDNLNFAGLFAMSDPPRQGVKEAIDLCQKAGIRVIMITGDNKLTAHSVADQIGLIHNERIISGEELEKLSPEALKEEIKAHNIYARVQPEQKYLIVDALQQTGEIVAMTGDGVNDAPALKKANIGIAMGEKGTEVARAAAGMILLDDNFSTIASSVQEGRRIYDNLQQAFVFLFSFHLPIVGLALLPLFFGHSLVFFPVHIIFLELICDPAAVLGFEREKARVGLMNEKPRPANQPLINPLLWGKIIIKACAILAVSFGFYYYYAIRNDMIDLGRTMAFGSLVVCQIFLILFTRQWYQVKSNRLLSSISALTFVFLFFVLFNSFLNKIFHLTRPDFLQVLLLLFVPLFLVLLVRKIVAIKN